MPWKRRTHGSSRQRGKAFYQKDDPKMIIARMKRSVARSRRLDKSGVLKPLHKEVYAGMTMFEIKDPTEREKHGGYRYLIQHKATSSRAFHTKEGLDKWLKDTGLKIGKEGWLGNFQLKGTFREVSMRGNSEKLDAWAKEQGLRASSQLDNGEYTRSYIKEGKTGNTIYYLNPNYKREILPYKHE